MPLARSLSLFAVLVSFAVAWPGAAQDAGPAKAPPVRLDQAGDPLPTGAVARLGTTRFRHAGSASVVGYAGNGSALVTTSGQTISIWDTRSGKELRRIELKQQMSRMYFRGGGPALVLSGDGKILVTNLDEPEASVIDVATGQTLRQVKFEATKVERRFGGGSGNVRTQLSHDGRFLLMADVNDGRDSTGFSVYDLSTGKHVRHFKGDDKGRGFSAAGLSRDGKSVVAFENSRSEEKKEDTVKPQIRFYDVATGVQIRAIPAPSISFLTLTLTADGKRLIVGGQRGDRDLRILDAESGKEIHALQPKQGSFYSHHIAPDQKAVFVVEYKQVVQYDLESGKEVRIFNVNSLDRDEDFGPPSQPTLALAIAPDGKTFAAPTQNAIRFWDIKSGKEIPGPAGHRNRIDSIAFAPNGTEILTGAADGRLYLWETTSGKQLREFKNKSKEPDDMDRPRRFGGDRLDLFRVRGQFSPDGATVSALWWGDKLHVFDTKTGQLKQHLGSSRANSAFAYSADGRHFALAGLEGALGIYDSATGRQIRAFGAPPQVEDPMDPDRDIGFPSEQGVYVLAFAPDGRSLLTGGMFLGAGLKVEIKQWELASGKERSHYEVSMTGNDPSLDIIAAAFDSFVAGFVFAPDGKTMLELGFSNMKLRDVRTNKELRNFGGRQMLTGTTCYSPDGKLLLAGRIDGGIRIWDLATGTVRADFPAHAGPVTALAFSADGKWLASGGKESSVLVWEWAYIQNWISTSKPKDDDIVLEQLWTALASDDAVKASGAITSLTNNAETVAFLKARLRPIPALDPKQLTRLFNDLEHPVFAKRQEAERAIEKLGDMAAPMVKTRLAGNPTLEMRRRLEEIQKKLDAQLVPTDVLQALRAIEALEMIGTPAAGGVLAELAQGAAGHRITEDARRALQRSTR